jgi:hypothetical protein
MAAVLAGQYVVFRLRPYPGSPMFQGGTPYISTLSIITYQWSPPHVCQSCPKAEIETSYASSSLAGSRVTNPRSSLPRHLSGMVSLTLSSAYNFQVSTYSNHGSTSRKEETNLAKPSSKLVKLKVKASKKDNLPFIVYNSLGPCVK